MTITEITAEALVDPFRVILILGLIATMLRTRAATGTLVPLLAGAVFVAVLIPSTLGASSTEPMWRLILGGLIANAVLIGIALALWQAFQRLRGG